MPRPGTSRVKPERAVFGLLALLLCGCGGPETPSGPNDNPEPNPAPSVTAVSPDNVTAGQGGLTLTVSGAGFVASSVVRWNDANRPTTYVDPATLRAAIPATDVAAGGTASVTVSTPAPGGGVSSSLTFSVLNPPPTATAVSPEDVTAGQSGFMLTVTGADFVASSVVRWNGSARPTTYVDEGTLRAAISASDVAAGATASVTVFTPAPGGGASDSLTVSVVNPVPSVIAVSPEEVVTGQDSFTITVEGANFVAPSVVRWNGTDRSTTYVDGGTLQVVILASDLDAAGSASITVFTPPPGGGLSSEVTLSWVNPVPSLTVLSSETGIAGRGEFTLTLVGTDFVAASVVRWNGSDRATTYAARDTLRAVILASDVAAPDTASITVFTPPPGGGTSDSLLFSVLPDSAIDIAFRSFPEVDGRGGEVYVMAADGTGRVRLTNHLGVDAPTGWSPDGSKIAFNSCAPGGTCDVYIMNTDGTGLVNLSNSSSNDASATWSPDGSRLAFSSSRDGNGEIYVVNADGTGLVNVTNASASDRSPEWSPDGSQLAFVTDRDGDHEIYVMNPDGTGLVNLTNSSDDEDSPRWSPDGSKLSFRRASSPTSGDVYVIKVDGTGRVNVSNSASQNAYQAWSPDGSQLAFMSTRDGNAEIYVVNADGTGLTRLTNSADGESSPVWSPDGSKIAYHMSFAGSQGEARSHVWVMNADGTSRVDLSGSDDDDDWPHWRPRR